MDEDQTIYLDKEAVALTIAGSDPSGGAGLQADLKTFQQLGVYGMSVISLITVQNTQGVLDVQALDPELVGAQLDAVLSDISPLAVKTGALGNASVIEAVGHRLKEIVKTCPVVVDPVLVSKHGDPLADDDAVEAYKECILPYAHLITPNRFEAEKLTGIELVGNDAVSNSIAELHALGPQHVLIKWGLVDGTRSHWLSDSEAEECVEYRTENLECKNTHGSGCVLSAVITAMLARGCPSMDEAVQEGMKKTFGAISIGCDLGEGIPPVDTRGLLPILSSGEADETED